MNEAADALVEFGRGRLPCRCGCGRAWLVSRGELGHDGQTVPFVAIPTAHDDEPEWWLAFALGEPRRWTLVNSWKCEDGDVAAAIVDPADTPLAQVLAPEAMLGRAEALADADHKARVFALHDRMVEAHPDRYHLRHGDGGRDFSCRVPDCVRAQPPEERSSRNGKNFAEHGDRRFVRALLPIPIADGTELRLGLWIEIEPEVFMALTAVFWDDEPAYAAMRVTGRMETAIVLGGRQLRAAEVTMAARHPSQCLFVTGSSAPWLAARLREPVSLADLSDLFGDVRRALFDEAGPRS